MGWVDFGMEGIVGNYGTNDMKEEFWSDLGG